MAKQGQAVSFDETMITETVDAIKVIDARLNEVKGTQAERLKVANLSILDDAVPEDLPQPKWAVASSLTTYAEFVDFIETDLADWLAQVDEAGEEARDVWLRDHKSAHADEVDTLKEERSVLVERAKALGTLLGVDVDIPKRSGGGTSSGSVKVSGAHFWVDIAGKRKEMSASQDKLSSVAWYHGRALCPDCTPANGDKGVSVSDLTKAIEARLGTAIPTTPWSVILSDGNAVGMDVLTPAEEEG